MDKLNEKTVIFDLESYKESIRQEIRKELEENIRDEIEMDVYYGLFRDMPINVLCEQFLRVYNGTDVDFSSLDEKGFCLMYAIVIKTCEYLRDEHVNFIGD